MIPSVDLLLFALASLLMVLSPGPNMIYLISRSLSQGKRAGVISLIGVTCGFLFHILMVSFGLSAIFFAIPYTFIVLKFLGVGYLLYLGYNSLQANIQVFQANLGVIPDKPFKLFSMGLLTNILNPKMAMFYLSFFSQFIKPANGSIIVQSIQLGAIQILISFTINFLIVNSAAKIASWFSRKPVWLNIQRWFMASVLIGLAVKMALVKVK